MLFLGGWNRLALPATRLHIDWERCLQLQSVDLSRTEISKMLGSTFAHSLHLQQLSLSSKLRRIGREAFLKCTLLREVRTPPTLLYIARRAFAGCMQLCTLHKT